MNLTTDNKEIHGNVYDIKKDQKIETYMFKKK
jgi:hypothetical protein